MRLTAELIKTSLSYTNPLVERELDLRGHKIPAVENLGAMPKDIESLDFTDNDITTLSNFPLSPRVKTLLCGRNRITNIQSSVSTSLPGLTTLVLAENDITELADLDALQGFARLFTVSLLGNPVTSKENYRYYLIWRAPQICIIDFAKVKLAERNKATEIFGTHDAPTELAQSIAAVRSNKPLTLNAAPKLNGIANGAASPKKKIKYTEEETKRFKILVKNAKSLAEVQKLEKLQSEGRLPPGVMDEDAMDET